jgi:hypothetical protein
MTSQSQPVNQKFEKDKFNSSSEDLNNVSSIQVLQVANLNYFHIKSL